jgi:hypothetical protein
LEDKRYKKLSESIDKLKRNAKFNRINKWFYKAAKGLTLRSHITVHKSFLRLKHNALGKISSRQDNK